jgi:hypothetical protein
MNAYEKLRSRKQILKEKFGDKLYRMDRVSSLTIDDELIAEVEECIFSSDTLHVLEGMNFLKGLLVNRGVSCLPHTFLERLVQLIPSMIESGSKVIVYSALEWFIELRSSYPSYRDKMLSLLVSDDVGEREFGLNYYDTFANNEEYMPLLSFENDDHACQMGHAGDWEYELRDKAFLLIERYTRKEVSKVRCKEPFEGAEISWFDWSFLPV